MCPKQQKLADPPPPPEKTADPTQVGEAQRKQDDLLFGGVPDLRSVVSALTSGGATAGGSGVNVPGSSAKSKGTG